ncbi:MAG TPA: MBL fold metallo-hydrolase [Solirubrobacteraceae bacterium]|nr:MBL fold metallo-hydrolase [Solirubrobacteraceae bacterium]
MTPGRGAAKMRELAADVHLLRGRPPNAINVYLVGDVLLDAATRQGEGRIVRQLEGRRVRAHALTHAHPDHQGSSHAVCERLRIPLWCGLGDVPAMERPGGVYASQPPTWLNRLQRRFWTGPPHPVAWALAEGDMVAGFTVLETPGHSRGHLAYWREADRVLILGDVLNSVGVFTGVPGLHEPPRSFTPDPARNRRSARRLAALRPLVTCFGHGAPLRDPGRLADFVDRLPE